MTPTSQMAVPLAPALAPVSGCITITGSANTTQHVPGLTDTVVHAMHNTLNRDHGEVEAEIQDMLGSVVNILRTIPLGWLTEPFNAPPPTSSSDLLFHLTIYLALISRLALQPQWTRDDEALFSRLWFVLFKLQRLILPLTEARDFTVPPLPPRICALLYPEQSNRPWDPLAVPQSQGVCRKLFDSLCTIGEIPGQYDVAGAWGGEMGAEESETVGAEESQMAAVPEKMPAQSVRVPEPVVVAGQKRGY